MTPARSAFVLLPGMTHALAMRGVAVVWPEVRLRLHFPNASLYKEGYPYAEDTWTADTDVLHLLQTSPGQPAPPDRVLLTGAMSGRSRREAIERSFGLVPDFALRYVHRNLDAPDTLDDKNAYGVRLRAAFVAKHGLEPHEYDPFDGIA